MRRKVLVVDDDADTRSLLAHVLSEYPVDVVEAAGDDEAYQRFLEVGPDLILLDVLLPRQGGLPLLRKIRGVRGGREVPVLVMSAVYKEADLRAEAVDRLGALDFLKKPFQMEVLRARLAEHLIERPTAQSAEKAAFPKAELLMRGDLVTHDFPVLLKNLGLQKITGRLQLRRGNVKKIIFFKGGEIVFALSNQIPETLGRYLLSGGHIIEDDYRAGLDAMRREGRKMGEFLVERGAMASHAVDEAICSNAMDKVTEVFSWPSGDFLVTPYAAPPSTLPGGPFDSEKPLWEGVRDRFSYDRISASLSPNAGFALFPGSGDADLDEEKFRSEEQSQFLRVLRRFEGQALSRVLSEVRGEREMRFLYFLLLTGRFVLEAPKAGEVPSDGVDLPTLERLRRARRRLEALRRKNCFQVLAVSLDSTDAKIRETYLQLAKETHPDMLGPQDPPELHGIHGEAFQIVQNAYETLKTHSSRRQYLDFIQEGLADDASDGARALEAESCFMEGKAHLKRRAWAAAAVAFRRAVTLLPDEGEYVCALGTALMKKGTRARPEDLSDAEKHLLRASVLLPKSPEPSYWLGQIAAAAGDTAGAAKYFQGSLTRDPNHTESLRELRLIRARSAKSRGVLSAIFGRKEPTE